MSEQASGRTRKRMGVVGTGYWAEVVHAAGAANHPDVDLVGVWGRDLDKARALAGQHGATAYDDFDALLAEVDLLTFAVPPQVQADLALRAAEAGKHLLLEKPLTTDLAAADRLVEAAERNGISTVVFFTYRFVPFAETWLDDVRTHDLRGGGAWWYVGHAAADSPFAASPWRKRDGALWDVGPHALSQILPALGPVTAVAGSRGEGDLAQLVLTHESGATSLMSLSMTMPFTAERVGAEFYDEHGWHVRPDQERDVDEAYASALSDLLANAAAGETRHRCDVRFGREVVEVLSRCQEVIDRP
ncbi:Gfo/Idh/MocA family protein [Nocardioides pocheonensis]|uniref:Gfo/Idh/MocA family oxidoreductase n=1 Tax=Nocardioides pocheonensis TaxID=661485 RepID=A0A3N0GYK3_9ACTN|nr:Gfo/Idh/MocA family oxidoreductase [Nocardioides pocheonensis]RNM17178.1 gfo/Idh/MocA family oxidoreductase [Nocardioides pocheonensis]